MKAKMLKEKIYLYSQNSGITFKIEQLKGLPVLLTIEDSLPEDGEYLFAGDIFVLSALDNLQNLMEKLLEENTRYTKGKMLNENFHFYSEKFRLFFVMSENSPYTINIEDSLPEEGEYLEDGGDRLVEALKNFRQFARDLMDEAINSEF